MNCKRCHGWMIPERFKDYFEDTGHTGFDGWRCLSCGEIMDSVIHFNRKDPPLPRFSQKRKVIVGINSGKMDTEEKKV